AEISGHFHGRCSELLVRDWALSPARMTFAHCSTYLLFYGFRVEQKSPAIFTGGGQNFLSEIGLFRQLGGKGELFAP
ncbi:MAG: hypothetical protein ACK55I_19565, partial [bacterium]